MYFMLCHAVQQLVIEGHTIGLQTWDGVGIDICSSRSQEFSQLVSL